MAEPATSKKVKDGPLIVGAGPTGLALAHRLVRHGVPFRIIDRNPGPGTASRAMVVHARSLELYQQIGLADDMVALGIRMEGAHLRSKRGEITRVAFGEMGAGLSPYPFVLSLAQDEHERLLVDRLAEQGVAVEWETALVSFSEADDGVHAVLDRCGLREEARFSYICGCDGAHSTVRQQLGLDFPGGTYDELFYVADVKTDTPVADWFVGTFGNRTIGLVFPVRRTGMQRLIGIVPPELRDRADLRFSDLQPYAEALLHLHVLDVNWFSTYRVHHRVAAHFRSGRVFIVGDAGHIHSPVGGQGMNTGIGDAVNLSWKLAHVLQGRIDPAVLDTYESERIAFARVLVESTDRAFRLFVGRGLVARFFRTILVPKLLPFLAGFERMRRGAFNLVSQIRINYEDSALSEGKAGTVRGGDRLPWVPMRECDNFAPLKSLEWQVHVYGTVDAALRTMAAETGMPVHGFEWSVAAERAGLQRDAFYLVRPDGYVALAAEDQDPARLAEYLRQWKLRPGADTTF